MINILVTAIISIISAIGVYNYAPLSVLEKFDLHTPRFGTTLTTILGSDTLSASRTTLNSNFTALNNGKIEVGSTTINAITTLTNLATVGTITSGAWNGTAIPVGYGGTGTTSPTSNQVMIGNGPSGFKVIGFGTSGQFLTSGGNGVAPTWTTSAIDQTASYTWTGAHIFSTSTVSVLNIGRINATSTASNTATSTITNLQIHNNATTTRLFINANGCRGCISGYEVVSQAVGNFNGGTPSSATATASCTSGKVIIGGGIDGGDGQSPAGLNLGSYPSGTTGWTGKVYGPNGSTANSNATVYAICAYQ